LNAREASGAAARGDLSAGIARYRTQRRLSRIPHWEWTLDVLHTARERVRGDGFVKGAPDGVLDELVLDLDPRAVRGREVGLLEPLGLLDLGVEAGAAQARQVLRRSAVERGGGELAGAPGSRDRVGDRAVLEVQACDDAAVGLGDPQAPEPDRARPGALAELRAELEAPVLCVQARYRVRPHLHGAVVGSEQRDRDRDQRQDRRDPHADRPPSRALPDGGCRRRCEGLQSIDRVLALGHDSHDHDGFV
jgi:hypothetical protein